MNSNENLPPAVVARIMKEIRALAKSPPDGIQVSYSEENISVIQADIEGPVGTPFEGGVFRIKLCLGADFPNSPPKGYFITKVFHPNVSEAGEICVNTLKKDWKPSHGLEHVLMVIRCLLVFPNAESALNAEAGKLLLEQYEEFAKRAQLMTKIHARPRRSDAPRKQLDESSSAAADAEAAKGSSAAQPSESKALPSPRKARAASASAVKAAAKPAPTKKTGIKRL